MKPWWLNVDLSSDGSIWAPIHTPAIRTGSTMGTTSTGTTRIFQTSIESLELFWILLLHSNVSPSSSRCLCRLLKTTRSQVDKTWSEGTVIYTSNTCTLQFSLIMTSKLLFTLTTAILPFCAALSGTFWMFPIFRIKLIKDCW